MSPDRPPAVVLFAPALDVGAAAPARDAASGPPGGGTIGGTGIPSPAAPADRLAEVAGEVGGGPVERSRRVPLPWESRLMTALGLIPADADPASARSGVPCARLLGAADLGGRPVERLVVADFVSLSPARDEATLAPAESLGLTAAETEALAESANALLAGDGIAFVRGGSGRWYLDGQDPAALRTPPAHFLARREIGEQLPASAEAAPWRRLTAELEMLWHAHPVNAAREARGAPPVNGVWFWGGAEPPPISHGEGPRPTLLAADPLARALGDHAGANLLPSGSTLDDALAACRGDALLVVDLDVYAAWLRDDAEGLDAAREDTLARLVRPAVAAVASGRAASFTLAGDAGEARVEAPPPRGWLARLFGGRAGR